MDEEIQKLKELFETLDIDSPASAKINTAEVLIEFARDLIMQAECDCRAQNSVHAAAHLNETKPELSNILYYLNKAEEMLK